MLKYALIYIVPRIYLEPHFQVWGVYDKWYEAEEHRKTYLTETQDSLIVENLQIIMFET